MNNLMIWGSLACIVLYVVAALVPTVWLVLVAFALLAGGGDLGIAVVGQLVGWLSDFFGARAPAGEDPAQYGLQTAMLVAIAVPVLSLACQVPLKRLARTGRPPSRRRRSSSRWCGQPRSRRALSAPRGRRFC